MLGYSTEQLISDLLDQYERHLEFLRLHRETTHGALPDHADELLGPEPAVPDHVGRD